MKVYLELAMEYRVRDTIASWHPLVTDIRTDQTEGNKVNVSQGAGR